jgi:hypothetical protein
MVTDWRARGCWRARSKARKATEAKKKWWLS